MERWILRRPSWLRFLGLLPIFLLAAAVCLTCANLAYYFLVKIAVDTGFGWLHFFIGLLAFFFAILFALICFFVVRDSFSQVFFSPQGIEQRRFGKCLCHLPWDELAELGIALEKWTVKGGPIPCLYFADRQLDELERAVIDEAIDDRKHSAGGKWIRVACKGLQNEDKLKEFCPLPVPSTRKPQDIKQNLLSFRRSRNTDGSWGEPETVILLDAGKIVHSFRMQQRKGIKGSYRDN